MNNIWQLRFAVLYLTLGVPLAASCAREANTLGDDEPGATGGKAGAGGTSAKAGTGPGASGSTSAFGGTSSKAGNGGSAVADGGDGTVVAGTSGGGSGGTGGAGGTTGVPPDVLARASAVVYYQCEQSLPNDGTIKMKLHIKNQSADPLPMASVKIRYWFTAEVAPSLHQYYTGPQAQLPKATFVDDGANSHTLMTFGGGSIVMGGDMNASEVQLAMDNNTGKFNQSDDFSFDPASTMSSPNAKITLYLADKLIWGCEPSGACFDDGGAGGAGAGGAGDGEPGAGGADVGAGGAGVGGAP